MKQFLIPGIFLAFILSWFAIGFLTPPQPTEQAAHEQQTTREPKPEEIGEAAKENPPEETEKWMGSLLFGIPQGPSLTSDPHTLRFNQTVNLNLTVQSDKPGSLIVSLNGKRIAEGNPARATLTHPPGEATVFVENGDGISANRTYQAQATWAPTDEQQA